MKQYLVSGMSCAACQARVEKAVLKVPGVESCAVSLLTNSMGVEGTAKPEEIMRAVKAAGYEAKEKADSGARSTACQGEDILEDTETPALKRRLVCSLGFLIVLMYISMGHSMAGLPLPEGLAENPGAQGLFQLLLTTAVMIINRKFFVSGAKSILNKAPNMDALVSLGAASAYGYSTWELFVILDLMNKGLSKQAMMTLHGLYFESGAMILTLITVGKMLEARSKGKTTDALKSLMKLTPDTAAVEIDGEERRIPVGELNIGDIFLVRPGENIPIDGTVIEGVTGVDESTLTGESIPVDKGEGSRVYAGTTNCNGFIRCRAICRGEDTTLSKIIQMVSEAAATKAPIAKIADKVSGVFVPAVIAIGVVTGVIWLLLGKDIGYALGRAISVLVISCPCSLGLATPVAIMVASGKGARNGILFKTSAVMERTGRTTIAVLDKTGTITQGKPEVTDILPGKGTTAEELMETAYSLEIKSEHPLANAIIAKAEELSLSAFPVSEFEALTGHGLFAKAGEDRILGGSMDFLESRIPEAKAFRQEADRLSEEGKTPLVFSKGNAVLGIIGVADTLKEDSTKAIAELKNMGIRVVMLTGDNKRTASAIGAKAGVDEVIAGVLPEGKEKAVRKLKEEGVVAMVGDGINDAPALTSADIGIAIGAGADVAVDAAQVVLMKNSLLDVPAAIRLSRGALRNIHQNLFWAFFYNCLGIPLAAGAFVKLLGWQLNPMFAAAAMSLSSFCVVTNALRLNLLNIYDPGKDFRIRNKNNKSEEKEIVNMEKTIIIEGMMCGHCEAHAKKALEAIDGVEEAIASHTAGNAVVTLSKEVSDAELRSAVEGEGYKVIEIR